MGRFRKVKRGRGQGGSEGQRRRGNLLEGMRRRSLPEVGTLDSVEAVKPFAGKGKNRRSLKRVGEGWGLKKYLQIFRVRYSCPNRADREGEGGRTRPQVKIKGLEEGGKHGSL